MSTSRPPLRLRFPSAAAAIPFVCAALLAGIPAFSASNVRILVDGRAVTLPETGDTVRDALDDARVLLGEHDEVSPPADTALPPDAVVRVMRVSYRETSVDTPIPYRTIVRPAPPGNRPYHPTVAQEGRSGLRRALYRLKIVDGREAQRDLLSEATVREPVHQIVISRNPAALGSRGAYTGTRILTVVATAYDPGVGSCGRWADGKTCNGKRAGYGVIAVDPKVIPLGAKLYVPGYGYGIAADVGRAIQGNRVDLGFNSRAGARQWGRKTVRLTIVE